MSLSRQLAIGMWPRRNYLLKSLGTSAFFKRHLPYCSVDTNLASAQLSSDFHVKFGKLLAKVLGKDEKLISVSVKTDVTLCRGGTNAPNAVIHIWSIGVFDAERNPTYSEKLYAFLIPELNIPPERIVLFFHPINKETAGHLLFAKHN